MKAYPENVQHPSVRRALETWYLSLPMWRPQSEPMSCIWCLSSPYRLALPDDVPLAIVHELVTLLEQEEHRGVALHWGALPDLPDLDAATELALLRTRELWTDVLANELARERVRIQRAIDAYVRPNLDRWIEEQIAYLHVADTEPGVG